MTDGSRMYNDMYFSSRELFGKSIERAQRNIKLLVHADICLCCSQPDKKKTHVKTTALNYYSYLSSLSIFFECFHISKGFACISGQYFLQPNWLSASENSGQM